MSLLLTEAQKIVANFISQNVDMEITGDITELYRSGDYIMCKFENVLFEGVFGIKKFQEWMLINKVENVK